jgi:toluene monooxygenase system protein D
MQNPVGPILRMNDDMDAIVSAIRADNPGKEIEVIDRSAYVRVQAENELKVTRSTLEEYLGRDFEMRELETMLSSFAGRIDSGSDGIRWFFKTI